MSKTIKLFILVLLIISLNCQRKQPMSHLERPVTFSRDGKQIVGMLHVPERTSPKHPAVLLLHGFTGNKIESHRLYVKLARRLAEAGFICLRFDFIGSGDSHGDFENMTILTELEDAKVAYQYLTQLPEVDTDRVGVLGLSMGGCVAALFAGETESIKSLVLWSAVARPQGNFQELLPNLEKNYHDDGSWYLDLGGFAVGQRFFEVLPEVKPLEQVSRFTGPVLIIHGENDQAVQLSAAHDYHKILKKRESGLVELDIIKNADHVFSSISLTNEVIRKTVGWFENTLK